jgi:hypothetical protein
MAHYASLFSLLNLFMILILFFNNIIWGVPGLVGKTAAMRADGGWIESLLGNVKFKKLIKK